MRGYGHELMIRMLKEKYLRGSSKKPAWWIRFCLMFIKMHKHTNCDPDYCGVVSFKMFRGVQYVYDIKVVRND